MFDAWRSVGAPLHPWPRAEALGSGPSADPPSGGKQVGSCTRPRLVSFGLRSTASASPEAVAPGGLVHCPRRPSIRTPNGVAGLPAPASSLSASDAFPARRRQVLVRRAGAFTHRPSPGAGRRCTRLPALRCNCGSTSAPRRSRRWSRTRTGRAPTGPEVPRGFPVGPCCPCRR